MQPPRSRIAPKGPSLTNPCTFSPLPFAPRPALAHPRRGDLQAVYASQPPLNSDGFVQAGPRDPQPDYTAIDSQPLNRLIYSLFRNRMVHSLGGRDSQMQGYPAIIDLTRRLNTIGSPRDTQMATRSILRSLFPPWLPGAFKVKMP